jgi:hypothetical protein
MPNTASVSGPGILAQFFKAAIDNFVFSPGFGPHRLLQCNRWQSLRISVEETPLYFQMESFTILIFLTGY